MRIFAVYPTHSPFVRKLHRSDTFSEKFHHDTLGKAWRTWSNLIPNREVDPADYLVVAADLTGEVDDRGSHIGALDWSTAVPAVVVAAGIG